MIGKDEDLSVDGLILLLCWDGASDSLSDMWIIFVSNFFLGGKYTDELPTFFLLSSKEKKHSLAEDGFDPSTSGLWAQHASAAPLCCDNAILNSPLNYMKDQLLCRNECFSGLFFCLGLSKINFPKNQMTPVVSGLTQEGMKPDLRRKDINCCSVSCAQENF